MPHPGTGHGHFLNHKGAPTQHATVQESACKRAALRERRPDAPQTAIDSVITVATGKKLQGTGVWSFLKVEGTPAVRAVLATTAVALVAIAASPDLVSALTTDSSINGN